MNIQIASNAMESCGNEFCQKNKDPVRICREMMNYRKTRTAPQCREWNVSKRAKMSFSTGFGLGLKKMTWPESIHWLHFLILQNKPPTKFSRFIQYTQLGSSNMGKGMCLCFQCISNVFPKISVDIKWCISVCFNIYKTFCIYETFMKCLRLLYFKNVSETLKKRYTSYVKLNGFKRVLLMTAELWFLHMM